MDLTNREYQIVKTRDYLFTNKICFFFQHSTEKSSNWLITEQIVVGRNLKYYKVNTLSARKVLKKSRYKLQELLISGTSAIVIKPQNSFLHYSKFTDSRIAGAFIMTAIKINNNLVSTEEFQHLNIFYYQIAMLTMYNYMLANIKFSSHMTVLSK